MVHLGPRQRGPGDHLADQVVVLLVVDDDPGLVREPIARYPVERAERRPVGEQGDHDRDGSENDPGDAQGIS